MTINLRRLPLHIRFGIRYIGVLNGVLFFLTLLACIAWLWVLPAAKHYLVQTEMMSLKLDQDLARRSNSHLTPTVPLAEIRLNEFYDALAEKRHVEQQIGTILALANKADLTLKMGEYTLSESDEGHFFTYRVQLPVKGTYAQIRQFAEQVLLTLPYASLDEIGFKRDSISNPVIESRITFTIFLRDAPFRTQGSAE